MVLDDGKRVDCVTDNFAVEVDFAPKAWAEGIGQALHYGFATGKQPAVLVILETESDCRHLPMLYDTARRNIPRITVWQTGAWAGRCE